MSGKEELSSSFWKHSQGARCSPDACGNLPNPRKHSQWAQGCLSIYTLIAISNCFCLFLARFLVIKNQHLPGVPTLFAISCQHHGNSEGSYIALDYRNGKSSAHWPDQDTKWGAQMMPYVLEGVGFDPDRESYTMNHCPIREGKPWPLVLLTPRRNAAKECEGAIKENLSSCTWERYPSPAKAWESAT